MKVKNMNRSSAKTKKLIKTAFAELLKEKKELNKITVSELVKIADINRGTFYIHYDSIYGVAEDFEEEILQTLMLDTQEITSLHQLDLYFDNVINYLKENEDLYKMLLSSKEPLIFLERIRHLINDKLYNALILNSKVYKSNSLKFDISFFTDGIIYQVIRYFIYDIEYTLDDISKYMKKYFKILFISSNENKENT